MGSLVDFKKDFPIFTYHPGLVYLDSAATSQKPGQVIKAVSDFYGRYNSNVHRGIYTLSQEATDIYEGVRKKIAGFIGAGSPAEIIFTGNASEAINLVAAGYARKFLKSGDIIILSEMEHHSNLVPWLQLRDQLGIRLFFLPVTKDYELDYRIISQVRINKKKIKLVALTHASNVLGTINPVAEIISYFKASGIRARFLVDAAQSIPHLSVSVSDLGCDFLAFSSHKMLGPSGLGILWAKAELLESMDPLFVGSHMISTVTREKAVWAPVPDKFETGTGRLEAVAGLGAALDYLQNVGARQIVRYENRLTQTALEIFSGLDFIDLYGKSQPDSRLGVFSFNLRGVHPHDVAEILNRSRICIRAGHHCAQPLMQRLGIPGTARASLYLYNTKEDLSKLADGLKTVRKIFTHD